MGFPVKNAIILAVYRELTYPTWGSSENHRLKSALLVGDLLVPRKVATTNDPSHSLDHEAMDHLKLETITVLSFRLQHDYYLA